MPVAGILIFIILYIISTQYYPGGSYTDHTSRGFDWYANYWCDLIREPAKNGETNTARPLALTAMFILCFSLAFFWYYLPKVFSSYKYNRFINYTGITSMILSFFLFTEIHDAILQLAGALGMLALLISIKGLYENGFYRYSLTGLVCFVFMLFNFYIYKTNQLIYSQAIIQKANFIFFLGWICWMDVYLYGILKTGSLRNN